MCRDQYIGICITRTWLIRSKQIACESDDSCWFYKSAEEWLSACVYMCQCVVATLGARSRDVTTVRLRPRSVPSVPGRPRHHDDVRGGQRGGRQAPAARRPQHQQPPRDHRQHPRRRRPPLLRLQARHRAAPPQVAPQAKVGSHTALVPNHSRSPSDTRTLHYRRQIDPRRIQLTSSLARVQRQFSARGISLSALRDHEECARL